MKKRRKMSWLIAIPVISLLALLSFRSEAQVPNLITPFPATELLYIKWDAFPNSVRYKLYWSNSTITDTAQCTRIDITTNGQIHYIHSNLTGSLDYYYVIFSIDNNGGSTMMSNQVVGTPLPQYYNHSGGNGDGHSKSATCVIKPDGSSATPNSQVITVYSGTEQNYIFWPQEAGAIDYLLEYSLSAGGTYTTILPNTTALNYTHTGLTPGTTYYYRVSANVAGCPLLPSLPVSGTVMPQYSYYSGGNGDGHCMDRTCVIKPSGVSATPNSQVITVYAGVEQNYIFWPQEAGTQDYLVEYSLSASGTYTTLAANTTALFYNHTGLTPGTTYYYRVSANVSGCPMLPSLPVSGTVMPQYAYFNGGNGDGHSASVTCVIKPSGANAAPNSKPITVYAGVNQNYIFWPQDAVANDYTLAVASSPTGQFSHVTTTTSLSYVHTGLTTGDTLYYHVTANVTGCPINPSLVVSAVVMGQYDYYSGGNGDGHSTERTCVIKPSGASAAPNSQPITVYAGVNQNYIFWPQDASANDYTLAVASSPAGQFSHVTTTTSLSYVHTGLTTGDTLYYHVTANVSGCPINPSTIVSAVVMGQYSYYNGGDGDGHSMNRTCVIKPDGVSATPNSQVITVYAGVEQNYIFWPQEAGTNDYTLEYSLSASGPFNTLAANTTALNYTHAGLTPGTTYYYRVSANAQGCPMLPSLPVAGTVMPQYSYYNGGDGDGHSSDQSCVLITLNATTIYVVGDTTDLCVGDVITLTASYSSNYMWSTGETTQSIDVSTSGSYHVNTFNIYSCASPSYQITLDFKLPPTYTQQPLDADLCVGYDTSFSVATTSGSAFLWYESTDGGNTWNPLSDGGVYTGTSTNHLYLTGVLGSMNNYQYQCNVTACGSGIASNVATLSVYPTPVITTQPIDVIEFPGNSTSFSLTTTGYNQTYNWYENQGSGWNIILNGGVYSGTNTSTLNISDVIGMDGYEYYCVVNGCLVDVFSDTASLTVGQLYDFTSHPTDVFQCAGSSASFIVTTTGNPSFQWYENQGSGWIALSNIGVYSGVDTATLHISDITGMAGYQYQCVISGLGPDITSNSATLNVYELPVILTSPADITECPGTSTLFSITASGYNITYQWYENQGSGWNILTNTGVYSGVTTSNLAISDITGMNGFTYECIVYGCSTSDTSNVAIISLLSVPTVILNPVDVLECDGNNASFIISALGSSPTYQWYENQGSGWIFLSNTGVYSDVTTNTLNISDVSGLDGYQYLCVVSACNVDDTSAAATVTLHAAPVITVHPVDIIGCSGGTNFSVAATGTAMTYQWYENQGSGWNTLSDGGLYSGTTSDTLFISDISTLNTYQYQCVVTTCAYNVTSNPATLTYSSTNVWLGYATDWDNSINWACGVPTATSDVTIPTSPVGGNLPSVFSNNISMCRNITLEPGASITIYPNTDISIYGDWNNGGTTAIGEGKVIFAGSSQIVTGTTTFGHITVNNGSTVTLMSSGQEVTGIVLCNGVLNANGNLTLLSTSSGTALISGSGVGSVNGTVTLQRLVASSQSKGYKHYSTAFSNSIVGHFSNFMTLHLGTTFNSPYPTLYKFSESAATTYFGNGWIPAAAQGAVNTPMDIGVGYTTQLGNGSATDIISYFYGTVNNGNYSVAVTRNNPGSGKGDGWNLIGNPYPSPIDLHKLDYTGANLNKSISIYISTSMYNGYYGYYNSMIGIPLNGGTRHLSSLHGCFVQCMNTAGGTLTMTNNVRSDVLNPKLYKTDELQTTLPFVKLTSGQNYSVNSLKDETVVIFAPDASYDTDVDYDASKIMNTEPSIPNIYTISNNTNLAINGLPNDFNTIKEVPVGLSVKTGGIYNITATEIANMPAGVDVYLEDKALGKLQNLHQNPEYIFTADVNSQAEGRFALVFGNVENTGISQSDNNINFAAWSDGEQMYVDIKGQQGNGLIELYDALGRIILNETLSTDGRYIYQLNLPAATYTLRYINGDTIKTVKMFMN